MDGMSIVPTSSKVPVVPVAAGAAVAQLGAVALGILLPFPALIAILLTAGAARLTTRGRVGPVVARTGLAVGAVSAVIGLVLAGLGVVTIILAGITVVAGVAGAVAGRPR
jgi:hypothetical protein